MWSKIIFFKNELDKACFAHDAAYVKICKDLDNRNIPDKFLRNRSYEIVVNPKYDMYQRWLVSMVHTFFDKKTELQILKQLLKNSKKESLCKIIFGSRVNGHGIVIFWQSSC